MDNFHNKDAILTPEDKEAVIKTLQEEVQQNENLKVLAELPSNNGVEEHIPEEGTMSKTMVSINPYTGEKTPVPTDKDLSDEDVPFEDILDDLGDILNSEGTPQEFDIGDITAEDVKIANQDPMSIGKYDISDETALQLVNILNRKKNKEVIKYKDLPEEIRGYIDKYIIEETGTAPFTNEMNAIRNNIADSLMEEYYTQIGLTKIDEDFQKSIEEIYEKSGKELSPLFKEYNTYRADYLEQIKDKVEDPEKRETLIRVIDSIHDSFSLSRIIDSDFSVKIKNYFLEKPTKVFEDDIEYKYRDSEYTMYKFSLLAPILDRHLKQNELIAGDDMTSAVKILLVFCRFCRNYSIDKPEDHAFMYYYCYNIMLLDIYKDQEYDDFAKEFLANNMKLLEHAR